jgi:AMP-polyphosphate phosphotransferase
LGAVREPGKAIGRQWQKRKARKIFESAERGNRIPKADYEREEPLLRARLLTLQYDMLAKAGFPVVIIIIGGVDGAGKGETLDVLHERMDPVTS